MTHTIGSEQLVLWGFAPGYRFYYRQANEALSSLPSPQPQPPAPAQMYTFGLGPCLGLGLEALISWLKALSSWPSHRTVAGVAAVCLCVKEIDRVALPHPLLYAVLVSLARPTYVHTPGNPGGASSYLSFAIYLKIVL